MTVDTHRSTPEQFLNLIRRQKRGRLKVYLESAAGVGKTYAMLREGQRLKRQMVDVAIGIVETHGRAETAEQIGDLEVIPPRTIDYRGVTLREMDLDAILTRQPTVCLVDELAYTNAPGSRHSKRFQDVEELLRAGIHVISTVNIQHMESLYDEVKRTTGVKVKERLPDAVLAEADQLVNVDVSAEDLLERLRAGKIYPPGAEQGAGQFLRTSRTSPGSAITLTEIAHLIDRRPPRRGRPVPGLRDRSGHGRAGQPKSQCPGTYPDKASRLADRLNAPWYAVYIQTPTEDLTRVDAATQRTLANNMQLAQQLGGVPMTFRGKDVARTIATFAREYGIKVIVMGKTRQPWYRRLIGGSILDRLLQETENVDVVVVDV